MELSDIIQAIQAGQRPLLTPEAFAERLSVTTKHIYSMKAKGLIPTQCLVMIGQYDYRIDWPAWLAYQRRKNGAVMYLKK